MSDLSERVEALLRGPVDSFDKLEVVLCLRRSADRRSTVDELATALRFPELSVEKALEGLGEAALVSRVHENGRDRFQFAPAPALIEALEELAAAYQERRLDVMNLLTTASIERMRSAAAAGLADAFLFRRDKKEKKDG